MRLYDSLYLTIFFGHYLISSFPRITVSRSHQGEVMKMAAKFKPPGVVTPAGGAGYKVSVSSYPIMLRQMK